MQRNNFSNLVVPIPTYIFKDRSIAVLEALVVHLREHGHTIGDIARLLNRDERTISTVIYRVAKKRRG
jgi:DNA-binding NarL/FixJ family response regulator